jgi:hypothetical protein
VTRVIVPSHLRSYTAGAHEIGAEGRTLGELIDDVESRHPGLKVRIIDEQDRIRPHVKCFVAGEQAWTLDVPITGEVQIIAALSGG